jgi:hypothetical protein
MSDQVGKIVQLTADDSRKIKQAMVDGTTLAGDFIPIPKGWLVGKLKKIANTGQSIEPDHWKYREMARETAQEILDKIGP